MKNYYIVDDTTTAKAAIYTDRLPDSYNETDALRAALDDWNRLTAAEQRKRDSFELIRAESDEDGEPDYNTSEMIFSFKYDARPYADEALEIVCTGNFNAAVALMDDEIREKLHFGLETEYSDYEFLRAYMDAHADKYGADFVM